VVCGAKALQLAMVARAFA
jgi:hypothetical protein